MINADPTPYLLVNELLRVLFADLQTILGEHLVGFYLDGSLATGDFDSASDIDFVAVTDQDITGELFLALQAMHDRLNRDPNPWAIQLEGSYISVKAIRRYEPRHAWHPNIERGSGERLKMVDHDECWAVHRAILRQCGIVLFGPPPESLIDPVTPDELRQAASIALTRWLAPLCDAPERITHLGYQSYLVLTICRILYTLDHGAVKSKGTAAAWGQAHLDPDFRSLIAAAWHERLHSEGLLRPAAIQQTLAFIRYALELQPMLLLNQSHKEQGED